MNIHELHELARIIINKRAAKQPFIYIRISSVIHGLLDNCNTSNDY